MKYIIFSFVLCVVSLHSVKGQENNNYMADFDTVFTIYSKRIEPYLRSFAENNYKNADEVLINATFMKYKSKVKGLRTEYLEVFERNKKNISYSKSYFHGVLDQAFQFEFPCLDQVYFTEVGKEVKEKIKRDLK